MQRRTPTVFIVDDDASVRKSLKRLFRSAGFEVQVFASGEDLFASDALVAPCCMMLDVQMPGMTGPEVQRRLVASGRDVPIIFITAHADAQVRDLAMQAGAVAFLIKPFDDQTLLDAVGTALNGAALDD